MQDSDLAAYLDETIKKGEASYARKRLSERLATIADHPIEHSLLVTFASLCRRAGKPASGIRLLNRAIRADIDGTARASDQEKTEYGACLTQIGAVDEAERILASADVSRVPQVLLFRSFCLFSRWRYAESIPLMKAYLAKIPAGTYVARVGQINLASALCHAGHYEDAEPLCADLIRLTAREGHLLLQGNAHEILGRILIERRDWTGAENTLTESERLLAQTGTIDFLFLHRWKAVLNLRRHGISDERVSELKRVRAEAFQGANWETARDCDFHLSLALKDRELIRKVYFGTPFDAYRAKVLAACRAAGIPSTEITGPAFVWPDLNTAATHRIDRHLGLCSCGGFELKREQLLHRLLKTLSADLYRPSQTAAIFGALYPGQHYDPASSPVRVRQAMKRFRTELRKQGHTLDVTVARSSHSLTASSENGVSLVYREDAASADLTILRSRFEGRGRETFSANEAAAAWGTSPRNASRKLQALVRDGSLRKEGTTRGCRFSLRSTP